MAVYQAPDIKDRIAVGDDLYQIADSGGKKKLTPDPTEVTEAGTPINKALLQPMADAIQALGEMAVPYIDHWWRRRPTASSYSEKRQSAVGQGYSHTFGGVTSYYLDGVRYDSGEYTCATLQYAASISINQSTGAVSLVSPASYTFTEGTDVSSPSVYSRFQGKYVKGFLGVTDKIFFIPAAAYMESYAWEVSGNTVYERGFRFTADSSELYLPLLIVSVKNTSVGSWETISSSSPDAYPRSGTSGGYDWAYLGRVSDAVLSPSDESRAAWQTVNLTSANFSGATANVAIPAGLALIAIEPRETRYGAGGAFGVLDTINGMFYGVSASDSSDGPSSARMMTIVDSKICYFSSLTSSSIYAVTGGLKFTISSTASSFSCTFHWLPLDSLEVGI